MYTNSAVESLGHSAIFPSVFRHFPEPPAWCCGNDGEWDVRIASSRTGRNFTYIGGDRQPFLFRGTTNAPAPDTNASQQPSCSEIGATSSWDSALVSIVRGYVEDGERVRMFYWGDAVRHGHHSVPCPTTGFAALELRQHGFASIDSAADWDSVSQLLTKPLLTGGETLWLNARTANGASISAELLGPGGQPLQGFALADSVPLSGNFVERQAQWGRANASVATAAGAGAPLSLRLVMRGHVELYSFRFGAAAGV